MYIPYSSYIFNLNVLHIAIGYSSYYLKIPTAFQYIVEGSMAFFIFPITKNYPLYITI